MVAAAFSVMTLVACSGCRPSPTRRRWREEWAPGVRQQRRERGPSGSSGVTGGTSSGERAGACRRRTPDAEGKPTQNAPQAGQLTAGVWDDNLNFDFYKKYLTLSGNRGAASGAFARERTTARTQLPQRGAKTELDVVRPRHDGQHGRRAELPAVGDRRHRAVDRGEAPGRCSRVFNLVTSIVTRTTTTSEGLPVGLGRGPARRCSTSSRSTAAATTREAVAAGLQTTADLDWRPGANVARAWPSGSRTRRITSVRRRRSTTRS